MPGEEYRDPVICNNCLWTASLLRGSHGFDACPACANKTLDVIPVNDYEAYTMNVQNKSVELEFTIFWREGPHLNSRSKFCHFEGCQSLSPFLNVLHTLIPVPSQQMP